MNRKQPLRVVKGMRDILPPDSRLWGHIEQVAREVFRAYAYREIRTPLVEVTELFARGVGQETDIVTKEMYTWEDHESPWPRLVTNALKLFTNDRNLFRQFLAEICLPRIESELEAGAIPKTAVNLHAIENLRTLSNELLQLSDQDPQFTQRIKAANILIDTLELGPRLTLRPEATASVVRAYIEHRLYDPPGLKKFYYMGPMFRRERPQKGRYRQFFQIGAEAIGSDSPTVDAEVLEMLIVMLGRLHLSEFTLLLNSVGCAECRPPFLSTLREELAKIREQLCADCQRRSETNPLRVFDCKVPADQPFIAQLPTLIGSLCAACREHFDRLQSYLHDRRIPFTIEPRLVRGLDYYTRTTFEIVHGALGAQNSLLGGGRYDGLSEALGGPRAPGIGFSVGEDRFVLAIEQTVPEHLRGAAGERLLYIVWLGETAYRHAAELARELRARDAMVEVAPEAARLKKSLEAAGRLGARYLLTIGDQELAEGKYPLRDMTSGELRTAGKDDLFREFGSPEKVSALAAAQSAVQAAIEETNSE